MKIWDLATRLYHWAQALLFMALMASGLSGNGHVQLGLALFTLLLWRLTWELSAAKPVCFDSFSARQRCHYILKRQIGGDCGS